MSEGAKTTRSGRTAYGGAVPSNPTLTSQILIGLNVAVWLLILLTGGRSSQWFDRLALRPKGGLVRAQGGDVFLLPDGVADGAYWQLLTSMFTHLTLLHIGFNMVALWLFGPQLELVLGRARFLALYLLSGLAGSAVVYAFSYPYTSTAGASGAIFGLLGAYFVVALKMRRNVSQILVLLGINAVITFTIPNISWQGHLGGLIGGALIAAALVYAPRSSRVWWQIACLSLFGVLLVVAFSARTLALT